MDEVETLQIWTARRRSGCRHLGGRSGNMFGLDIGVAVADLNFDT
jgi:hypothetical protein